MNRMAKLLPIWQFILMSLFVACGGQPSLNASQSSEQSLRVGPNQVHSATERARAEADLTGLIQIAGEASSKGNTRGVNDDQARALVKEGRALMKQRDLDKALELYERAQKIYPDEDHLLLIAATRHLLFKRDSKSEQCHRALLDWQVYLKRCERCKSVARYHDQAVINANTLGERCGAWTVWESEPMRAKLSLDRRYIGRTPLALWAPIGRHQYELKRADLRDRGELNLSLGQRREIKARLSLQNAQVPPFMIAAQLKCLRGKEGQAQPKRCANSLRAGDLFTVELVSDQDVFIYLFGLSDQELVKLHPHGGKKSAGAIPGGKAIVLPQRNAWLVDDRSNDDELWLLATQAPLNLESSQEKEGLSKAEPLLKELSQSRDQSGTDDLLQVKSVEGVAFLRWVIRRR